MLFTELQKTANVLKQVSPGRPWTSTEGVESQEYHVYCIPNKYIAHHSLQVGKPATMIQSAVEMAKMTCLQKSVEA